MTPVSLRENWIQYHKEYLRLELIPLRQVPLHSHNSFSSPSFLRLLRPGVNLGSLHLFSLTSSFFLDHSATAPPFFKPNFVQAEWLDLKMLCLSADYVYVKNDSTAV